MSSYSKPFNYSRAQKVEEWVNRFILNFEIMSGQKLSWPLPIEFICQNIFGFVTSYRQFNDKHSNSSGVLNPMQKQIIVSMTDPQTRIRFTFAHEIAHWLMLKILFPGAVLSANEFLIQSRDFTRQEREEFANYTARALLIPFPKLYSLIDDFESITSEYYTTLADVFGVSYLTIRHRVDDLKKLVAGDFIPAPNGKKILDYSGLLNSPDIFDHVVTVIELKYSKLTQFIVRSLNEYSKRKGELILLIKYSDFPMIATVLNFPGISTIVLYQDQAEKMIIKSALDSHPSPKTFLSLTNLENLPEKKTEAKMILFNRTNTSSGIETSEDSLNNLENHFVNDLKINTRKEAKTAINTYREDDQTVVLATGCFDVIDDRKIRFLSQAKKLGDVLIVGVEDENRIPLFRSEQQLKQGITNLKARIEILSQFVWIDLIFAIRGNSGDEESFYRKFYRDLNVDYLAVLEDDPNLQLREEELLGSRTQMVVVRDVNGQSEYLEDIQSKLFDPEEESGVVVIRKSIMKTMYRKLYGS